MQGVDQATRITKLLGLLVLLLLCTTCGTPNVSQWTSSELFPLQIGQVWHMVNKLGDVTTWTVEQPPENSSCEVGPEVLLHITKNAARTYWMLGEPGVEDHWVLHRDPDGSVRSIQDTPHWSDGCAPWGGSATGPCYATVQWRPVPGLPLPNTIIPATMGINDNISIPTKYHLFSQWTQGSSYQCIATSENDKGLVDWVSGFYTTNVDTPVYKGIAMANDQYKPTLLTKSGTSLRGLDSYKSMPI